MGGWELMHRHQLVGRDGVIGVKHALCEVAHDGFSCKVEVAEHLVRPPAAKEPNDIGVDFGDQEGHGSTCSKGAGRDLGRDEAEVSAKEAHCHPEVMGDDGWGDTLGSARC